MIRGWLAFLALILPLVAGATGALAHVHGAMAAERAALTASASPAEVAALRAAAVEVAAAVVGDCAGCSDRHHHGAACACTPLCLSLVEVQPVALLPVAVARPTPAETAALVAAVHRPPAPPPRS